MSVIIQNLTYTYGRKTPYQKTALQDINLTVEHGEFLGIIGHTGCGKSTLISHLNALTRVQTGKITVGGIELTNKKTKKKILRTLRSKVGMVFQYPEYQLFADTVLQDVAFGPKNLRLPKEEIFTRAKEAIELVGLDFNSIRERSVFELSGGQKRRVAIAGVLAMRPEILILDEPTSGLDPKGKKEILDLVQSIRQTMCPTVIMISHNMDEVAAAADRIAVMADGQIVCIKTPKELFGVKDTLAKLDIKMPAATSFANDLADAGFAVDKSIVTEDELVDEIMRIFGGGTACAI